MKYVILMILIVLCSCSMHAQTDPNRPAAPLLHSVSIDIETGYTIIIWFGSDPPDNVDYYEVRQLEPSIFDKTFAISGYLDDGVRHFPYSSELPHQKSVGFTVDALKDMGGSNVLRSFFHTPDSTIFLESEFDSCEATITLNWNDYNNWRGSIAEYNIKRRLGPGIYDLLATTSEGTNTMVLEDIEANQSYDLFVEVVHDDLRASNSNRIEVNTQMTQVPDFANADYATIGSANGIDLSFTTGTSGLNQYNLLRSQNFEGPFESIGSFSQTGSNIRYTDEVLFTSGIYYYKLEVINNCGLVAIESNRANNIVLTGSLDGMSVSLEWNEYRDWLGNVQDYRVIRTHGQSNPVTETLDPSTPGSTVFTDDISSLADYQNPSEGLVCYSVISTENLNINGIQGISQSNQVCFSVNPGIRIPNAFIPNDTEPVNRVFEPIFSFEPEHYEMIIYNRTGSKIWEGSTGWDGKVNGNYVHEGVYVYYMKVFDYNSGTTEFQGKVTVLYR